jgi:hypothetical protein
MTVVLCGREAWSCAARPEQRLEVFENRVLRVTSKPKMEGEIAYSGTS